MPKVAICFSGLPRANSASAIACWRQLIDRYDAHVFIHTWASNNRDRNYIRDRIMPVFNPILIQHEMPRKLDLDLSYDKRKTFPDVINYNVFSSFISMYESFNLLCKYTEKNNFKYDVVVRGRFDVEFNQFDIKTCDGITVSNDLQYLKAAKCSFMGKQIQGVNDLIAYGSQEHMRVYSGVINHLDAMYHTDRIDFCSELFLTANLIKHNIPIITTPISVKIVRA